MKSPRECDAKPLLSCWGKKGKIWNVLNYEADITTKKTNKKLGFEHINNTWNLESVLQSPQQMEHFYAKPSRFNVTHCLKSTAAKCEGATYWLQQPVHQTCPEKINACVWTSAGPGQMEANWKATTHICWWKIKCVFFSLHLQISDSSNIKSVFQNTFLSTHGGWPVRQGNDKHLWVLHCTSTLGPASSFCSSSSLSL